MPMPPLEVADLSDAPEDARDHYVEQDGKFVFDFDKHVAGLKSGLKKEREEAKTARERAAAAQAELDALKTKPPEPSGKGRAADEDRIAKLEQAIEAERKRREESETQLATKTMHDTIRRAYLAAGGFDEDADDVITLVAGRFSRDESGGMMVDADDPMIKTADDFFAKEFRAKRPKFFKARESGGGGAPAGRPGGAGTVKSLADLKSVSDKTAFIKQHGHEAYQKLVDTHLAA